jgi:exopolyphosphatase / guanosine-5'-triphosphate,3'-diphosphate pyrophosphatase
VTRVAAVDLGTNSTRLLVADVDHGRLDELARRLTITRLGEGVDDARRLQPAAIGRVRDTLGRYTGLIEELGAERTLCVATSAVRDAENGDAFLRAIGADYGFATRRLSGAEEALMTFRGVTADRALAGETLIVDIGGGSTELILGDREGVHFHTSLDIGCVRLTERFGDDLSSCAAHVRAVLPALHVTAAIGVAGTVTSIAALDLKLVNYDPERVHGHSLSAAAVDRELDRLAALPLAERRRVPGLEPERAPVIVAGAVILREILRAYGLGRIEASEHDLLHGAALAAAAD